MSYTYPLEPERYVLRNISLVLETSEFVAILGPSGSGKSTLLHLMGTMEKPQSGTVLIDGINIGVMNDSQLSRLRLTKIGFVFQQYHLLQTLTAVENVLFSMQLVGIPNSVAKSRARELLKKMGMQGKEASFPSQLSGGQQQRVAIARFGQQPQGIASR